MRQAASGSVGTDHKVIRIPHQVDLVPVFATRGKVLGQQPLQPIQCLVGQDGRDDAALGCPGRGGVDDAFFQRTFAPVSWKAANEGRSYGA